MQYTKPQTVLSPKVAVSNLRPIYDGGPDSWAAALMDYEQEPSVGVRWNGEGDRPGNPQSRGLPTWFVMPKEISVAVLRSLVGKGLIGGGDISRETAEQAIQRFIALHGENESQGIDADFEVKVREVIGKLIGEGKLQPCNP
jgi:hypothetical protein